MNCPECDRPHVDLRALARHRSVEHGVLSPKRQRALELARQSFDTSWMVDAACRGAGTRAWFPDEHEGVLAEGKAVCAGCPVRARCAWYAIEAVETHGCWGGFSPKELVKLRNDPIKRRMTRIAAELEAEGVAV